LSDFSLKSVGKREAGKLKIFSEKVGSRGTWIDLIN